MTSKAQAKDDIFVPFSEQQQIDRWLQNENLNRYGDPLDTMYMGGTPLFNEQTGESQDRYQYLLAKFPSKPWKSEYKI